MRKLFGSIKPISFLKSGKFYFSLALVVVFVLGGLSGIYWWKNKNDCKNILTFINPSLNCEAKTSFDKSNPIVLKDKLSSYIDGKKKSGDIDEASVYFRDLNNGPTLGIDEDALFISASLLKLPISLTLYKLAEEDQPDILNKNLEFKISGDMGDGLVQYFKPEKTIEEGKAYSVDDLIYDSLVYSDNLSNDLLKGYLAKIGNGQDLILRTLKDLGLTEPTSVVSSDISTRSYASIFRILYNASYLNNEDSDKVLSILSESKFDMGIAAGIPKDVRIANKFGERDLPEQKQLHDCGIVYFPGNPYLLCVMTRGKSYDSLTSVIKDISKIVYDDMLVRSKKNK